jgi:UDP-glucose 6-dehydrogenase
MPEHEREISRMENWVKTCVDCGVVNNPEFLHLKAQQLSDYFNQPLMGGIKEQIRGLVSSLYSNLPAKVVAVRIDEICKYVNNTFHASTSFANKLVTLFRN